MQDEKPPGGAGRPIKNREDLELLQFVLQDDTARAMQKMARSQAREEFEGRVVQRTLICSGTEALADLVREEPYHGWKTASFYNRGADTAEVAFNHAWDWQAIDPSASLEVDFMKAQRPIEVLYYRAAQGRNTTVIATGKY